MTRIYSVPGISCDHCKHAIEDAVAKLDGVDAVVVDVTAKNVRVEGAVPDEKVRVAIDDAGYDVADDVKS